MWAMARWYVPCHFGISTPTEDHYENRNKSEENDDDGGQYARRDP